MSMDTSAVSLIVAFAAGITSFLAPCTLALVPAFLTYLAGFTLSSESGSSVGALRRATVLNTATFIVGFTMVFVLLGSSLGALSQAVGSNTVWLNRVGGVLIMAFGLTALGLVKVPMLERGFAPRLEFARRLRYFGSFLVGAAFAVSWVPCVGPILGAIFVLAGTSGSAQTGAVLLFAYSLGMMLPFLAAGTFTGMASGLMRRHGKTLQYTNYAGGVLLILLGVAVFTNLMPTLAGYLPFDAIVVG